MQRWAPLAAASITARVKPAAQCRMLMLPSATATAALVTAQPVTRRMDVRMDARMNTRMNARMIARMALAPRMDARMNARMDARIAWMLTMSCASLRGVRHVPLGPSLVVVYIKLYGAAIYIASGWIGTFHPSKKLVCESGRQPSQVILFPLPSA